MNKKYYLNETSECGTEVCWYDADKYYAPEGNDETNLNNEKKLPFAFGHELSIDIYYPEYFEDLNKREED